MGRPCEVLCALFGFLSGMEATAAKGWEHRTVWGRGRDLGVVSVWTMELLGPCGRGWGTSMKWQWSRRKGGAEDIGRSLFPIGYCVVCVIVF